MHPVVSERHSLELFSGNAGPALATLAAEINAEHEAAESHARKAIEHARKAIEHARAAGDKLLLAKAGVAHGQWLPWMAANCPKVSIRRAQEYMRVAREWPALQAKYADSAHLTIDSALALLAAPTPALPPVSAPPPALATAPPAPAAPAPAPETPPANPPQRVSLVEKINREHQLSRSKADEAKRHELALGKMLLQIKASKQHGEWLPWLNGEIESGRLKVKSRQARSYMRLASNWQRAANLTEAPSIRAALELLSDKEPEEQQGDLIDVEAERQAREAAEAKAEAERRARERTGEPLPPLSLNFPAIRAWAQHCITRRSLPAATIPNLIGNSRLFLLS